MTPAPVAAPRVDRTSRLTARSLTNGPLLGLVAAAAAFVLVLYLLQGWRYYGTPPRVRGYDALHRVLRPSGRLGHPLGIAGSLIMAMTFLYTLRKKWKPLARFGPPSLWLEFHIFCGLFGPALITLHTSFKFNGIVSVSFWSMTLVVLSGFVGRFLFVRIPRTIRGTEVTVPATEERVADLKRELADSGLSERVLSEIQAFETRSLPAPGRESYLDLVVGEVRLQLGLLDLRRTLSTSGVPKDLAAAAGEAVSERLLLMRRIAYLRRTKKLFDLWHVLHRPLVYVMFAILVVHVGVTVYFGYSFPRR